jgi:imidazolonepropionase-like amidohydrolase
MIAITHVTVIPMDHERLLYDQTVMVDGERIIAIDSAEEVPIPAGATRVDGQGAFLLPGLADMHFHVDQNPVSLTLAVANGVTTVQNFNATPEDIALGARFCASRSGDWR